MPNGSGRAAQKLVNRSLDGAVLFDVLCELRLFDEYFRVANAMSDKQYRINSVRLSP